MLLGNPAYAQEPASNEPKEAPTSSSAANETTRSKATAGTKPAGTGVKKEGKRRIALEDEFLVEGKLEKPSVFYILRRSSLDYDWARLDARFTPLVLESVQDPLF
jgi:hypothetical protein